jgi:hypothetical protein
VEGFTLVAIQTSPVASMEREPYGYRASLPPLRSKFVVVEEEGTNLASVAFPPCVATPDVAAHTLPDPSTATL